MANFSMRASGMQRVLRSLREVRREEIPQAAARALNHAQLRVQTESVRDISKAVNIAQRALRARWPRPRKATKRRLVIEWEVGMLPVLARKAGAPRQTRAGVSIRGRSLPGAFTAPLASGVVGVFTRKPQARASSGQDAKGRPRRDRLPLATVTLPVDPPARHIIERHIATTGETAFALEFERLLRLRGAR